MKRLALSLVAILAIGSLLAQNNNDILLKVGSENITKEAFVNAYQKNNSLSSATETDLREYLDLYINYRMKVLEAQSLKMDTSAAFVRELASYENQSAQQYLIDTEVSEQLLNEAFERAKIQVRASHILVMCGTTATPKDTLTAYHKIMQIRDKIMKGMDFNEAAVLYSEDKSARDFVNPQTGRMQRGNRGELGFFSVLEMIYPFECAAFNTPVGQVSMPVRSQYGYHLVYVQEKVPAMSQIYLSQIFIADTQALTGVSKPEIMDKVREVSRRLNDGSSNFATLVEEFSEDLATKDNGGAMMPFGPSRRPGNYVSAAIHLQPGEVSDPVPTSMGWHFLKLDSIIYVNMNEEGRYILKNRLSRDPRSRKSQSSFISKLKNEYNYEESGKKAAMKFFKKNLSESYFSSTKVEAEELPGIEKLRPMATFADVKLTAEQFAQFLSRFKGMPLNGTLEDVLEKVFPTFVSENIMAYEKAHLKTKYPEYRDLVAEFHDGMLLYEINSKKVWNAAAEDTTALERYYETIKTDYPTVDSLGQATFKPLEEVRASVINKYQDYLEKQWLKELHEKYPVTLDEKVFRSILKK